jgi:hypothetical protein
MNDKPDGKQWSTEERWSKTEVRRLINPLECACGHSAGVIGLASAAESSRLRRVTETSFGVMVEDQPAVARSLHVTDSLCV